MGSSRPSTPEPDKDWLRLGVITGAHGIRGHVRLKAASYSEGAVPDWLDSLDTVRLTLPSQPQPKLFAVLEARMQGKSVVLRLSETPTRNDAEALIGAQVFCERGQLPEPDEDSFWVDSLIGATVVDGHGVAIAKITDISNAAGRDFLELARLADNKTLTVPFQSHFFPEVDAEKQRVVATLPDELWEL